MDASYILSFDSCTKERLLLHIHDGGTAFFLPTRNSYYHSTGCVSATVATATATSAVEPTTTGDVAADDKDDINPVIISSYADHKKDVMMLLKRYVTRLARCNHCHCPFSPLITSYLILSYLILSYNLLSSVITPSLLFSYNLFSSLLFSSNVSSYNLFSHLLL